LFKHPDRLKWNPGFGGLCLHSILVHPKDPKRIYAAVSSGGIYCTDDGGDSWTACVNGLRVHPDVPCATLCPHKLRFDAENPSRMYLQNHPGVIGRTMKRVPGSRSRMGCRRISAFRWSRIRGAAERFTLFR
jgi:hypothetical protein